MRRGLSLMLALAIVAAALLGAPCGKKPDGLSGSFKITGSNTVTPLTSVWAEEFMAQNPGVSISVSGPGSGVGIASLIDGTTEVAQASRKISQKEIDQARAKGREPYEIQVASDALAVVVHPSNPVSALTIAQISGIYSGDITNWSQVGGLSAPIVALSRDTNSGTHVFFKEHVVQMAGLPGQDTSLEFGQQVLMLPSTEEGVSQVAGNVNAIFYPGLGYLTAAVKPLGIKRTAGSAAVLPSVATVLDGSYPIARPLLYYTNGAPDGAIKAFIDYVLSAEGQQIVTDLGYVPLPR